MVRKQGRPRINYEGRYSKHRIAWVETFVGQFALLMYPEGYNEESDDVPALKTEPGSTIRLMMPKRGRAPEILSITALTSEELASMRELFNLMFDMAEPIVAKRDKAAQDAYEEGDDAFSRIYRSVPRLIVREGAIRENSVSVRERLEGRSEGPEHGRDSGGGLRGVGGVLDGAEQAPGGGEDDRSEDD